MYPDPVGVCLTAQVRHLVQAVRRFKDLAVQVEQWAGVVVVASHYSEQAVRDVIRHAVPLGELLSVAGGLVTLSAELYFARPVQGQQKEG